MSSFITRNKPDWDELEALVQKARKSFRRMSPEELSRLDVLYRRTTVHLSQVATRTTDARLIAYLNDLTAAAHSLIYLPPRTSAWQGAGRFVVEGFPRLIARRWPYHATSAAILIAGALLGYFASMHDALAAYALMMPGDVRSPGSTPEQLLEVLRHGRDQGGGEKFAFASMLFGHNLRVGILSMVAGVLGGVFTTMLILYNGMILGAFVAIHHRAGIHAELWAWILPHGITELGAIVLFGGIGLLFAQAVISPGLLSRAESLKRAGVDAGRTCLGAGAMLVAAAIIESYLRQSHLSTAARLAFAGGSVAFWALYIAHGFWRERSSELEAQAGQGSAAEAPAPGRADGRLVGAGRRLPNASRTTASSPAAAR